MRGRTPSASRRRKRWLLLTALCLLGVIGFAVDYWAFPYGKIPSGDRFNKGSNGLWLRYKWYVGEKTPEELRKLPGQLKERQIRSAWFHVRSVGKTGKLDFHSPVSARQLTATVRQKAPGVRALAWVYVGNKRGTGEVDLADKTVRKTMVEEAVWLTTVCGFDGIQWDYEICDDNDLNLLNLLRETRAAMPPDKTLSVATPMWLPSVLSGLGWSESYFTKVSAQCDEIAVMCYDSGFLTPRSYVWIVAQQAPHITQAVAKGNPRCQVILGVPTYDRGLFSHNPRAENLGFALLGVRQGLADPRTNKAVFAGVAPFADYTVDTKEWKTWRDLWLDAGDPKQ